MSYLERIASKGRRLSAEYLARNILRLNSDTAFISFTFDDFPANAFTVGGRILAQYGLTGTYYVSFGSLNRESPSGQIADLDIVRGVIRAGHELGCHTYGHVDAWKDGAGAFEKSIIENRNALSEAFPGKAFSTFAYPIGNMTPRTKRIAQKYFVCARGGGQDINSKVVDLNNVSSFFLDGRTNNNMRAIVDVIDRNAARKGWLVFTTHDVDRRPSRYGCETNVFEMTVDYSLRANATVLPVRDVVRRLTNLT